MMYWNFRGVDGFIIAHLGRRADKGPSHGAQNDGRRLPQQTQGETSAEQYRLLRQISRVGDVGTIGTCGPLTRRGQAMRLPPLAWTNGQKFARDDKRVIP